MERIYINCNIIIDWLTDREPFSFYADELFSLIESNQIEGCVSPLVLANTYYLLMKHFNKKIAYEFLKDCQQLFTILDLSKDITIQAINGKYKDFEDDLHYYIAIRNKIKYIITRNKKDFKIETIKILTAEEYLNHYKNMI